MKNIRIDAHQWSKLGNRAFIAAVSQEEKLKEGMRCRSGTGFQKSSSCLFFTAPVNRQDGFLSDSLFALPSRLKGGQRACCE